MRYLKAIVILCFFTGSLCAQQRQYDEIKKLIGATKDNADSLYFLNKQLLPELIRLNKPKEELALCYISLSEYALRIGNMTEAASYASDATLLCEVNKIESRLGRSYFQKARVLNYQNKYDESLIYLRKGLSNAIVNKKKKGQAKYLGQIGFTYASLKELDSALYYQNEALAINAELKDTVGIANSYSNIGYVYSLKGMYELSRKYFYKALYLNGNAKDVYIKAGSLVDCGNAEQDLGNTEKCIKLMNDALKIIKEEKIYTMEASCYQTIAAAYEKTRRWDSAFKYHKLFKAVSDSLYNQEMLKSTAKVEAKYQLSSKQNEIALLTEKNKTNELLVTREKMIRWIFIGGIILLIIILFMVFRQLKIKKEAYTKINEQKEIIEEKNKEIIDSIHYAKRIQTALMSSEKSIEGTINRMKR
jgi:tetratricopeptide (TPR) repeat protein